MLYQLTLKNKKKKKSLTYMRIKVMQIARSKVDWKDGHRETARTITQEQVKN
jgi:hypothetical protein